MDTLFLAYQLCHNDHDEMEHNNRELKKHFIY